MRKSRLPRSKVDLDRDISMTFSRYPLALKLCLNFKRYSSDTSFGEHICSKQSDCLAFNETMFYAWWVAFGEVRKLKGLGRLVMGFDVQVGFFANLSPLNTVVSRKVVLFSDISAVNLIPGWK